MHYGEGYGVLGGGGARKRVVEATVKSLVETPVLRSGRGGFVVTLPKRLLKSLGLKDLSGCRVLFTVRSDGSVTVRFRLKSGDLL